MTATTVDERIPAEIAEELARITFSYELVTPGQAKMWLANQHPHQRRPGSLHSGKPKRYSDIMAERGWDPAVPQPVMLADPELLLNGGNRLAGIVLSDTATILFVARHVPERVFDVIDTGRARFPGQFLNGGAPGPAQASVARWLMWYEDPERFARKPSGPAMSFELRDVVKYATEHRGSIARAVQAASAVHKQAKIPVAIHAAVLVLARERGTADAVLDDWLHGLETGVIPREGDARLAIRSRFLSRAGKRNAGHVASDYAALVVALNAHIAGEPLTIESLRTQGQSKYVWPKLGESKTEFDRRGHAYETRVRRTRTAHFSAKKPTLSADARAVEELVLTTGRTLSDIAAASL